MNDSITPPETQNNTIEFNKYHLASIDGTCFLFDSNNKLVMDVNTISSVMGGLQESKHIIREANGLNRLDDLVRDTKWEHRNNTREGLRGKGGGVYFIYVRNLDAMKIGRSKNLYTRVKASRKDLGGGRNTYFAAVGFTNEDVLLEQSLHYYFGEHQIPGYAELFNSDPVINFLARVAPLKDYNHER